MSYASCAGFGVRHQRRECDPRSFPFSLTLRRQSHSDRRLAGTALYAQISMMGLHDAIGNAQTKTRTRYLMPHRRTSVKPFKNATLLLDWYPTAMIGDFYSDHAVEFAHSDSE